MKKYFCETNGYNMLVYVDDSNRAYGFDCETLEHAKKMDTSGADGENDIEVLAVNCNGDIDKIFDFHEDDFDNVVEIKTFRVER